MNNITVVMYHYVRDIQNSKYPNIKGLDIKSFQNQLDYLQKYYNIISPDKFIDSLENKLTLPNNSALLTFDDAYIDHFNNVFPILKKRNIFGCFFPPVKCVLQEKVLDVNKIHFILASASNVGDLIKIIFKSLDKYRSEYKLESNDFYWKKCAKANRYDNANVKFVKNILQRDIDEKLRGIITDELFSEFVCDDEKLFASELYMNHDQVLYLHNNGMYIGGHGFDHYHLDSISSEHQKREIDLTVSFLDNIGTDINNWMMCYPYGDYNESLLDFLKLKKCLLGFTTNINIANLNKDNLLTLPRLDTNDLPKIVDSKINSWTKKII
jgi:peptidoglycan/xylan/chitin deacetylase (PgdA/CDA1 family)